MKNDFMDFLSIELDNNMVIGSREHSQAKLLIKYLRHLNKFEPSRYNYVLTLLDDEYVLLDYLHNDEVFIHFLLDNQ